jgi:hypothetical protein
MKTVWTGLVKAVIPIAIMVVAFSLIHLTNTVLQVKNDVVPRL